MKKKFSIQVTILLSFLTVLVIACGSIIYYNYNKTSDSFLEDLSADIELRTKIILGDIESYLMPAKVSSQFIAWISKHENNVLDAVDDITVQGMKLLDLYPQINGFYNGDFNGNLVALQRVKEGQTYPFTIEKKLPSSARYEIRIINRSTGIITEFLKYLDANAHVVALEERPRASDYFDPRQRPWYQGAAQVKGPYWSDPYIFLLSQHIGITASIPILSESGRLKIMISADITLDAISALMTQHKIGKNGVTFMLNQKGDVVGYPNLKELDNTEKKTLPTYKNTNNPILIQAYEHYKKSKQHVFNVTHHGITYLIRFKEFGEKFDKNWLIGFIIPRHELTGIVDDMTELMMIFSLLIVVFSAFFIFFLSKNIAAPIQNASHAMAAIARFDIDKIAIKDSKFSEIDLMNKALRNMQQSLQDFSRFVPKAVVSKLMTSESGAKIGGRKRNISLMFTDIKGFTSISEKISSEKLILHLSDYLNQMTHIIQDNHGTIDKYIGDAIMTFWGAPLDDPKHHLNACKAALACKAKLEKLNKTWVLDGKPALYTRFGIHTGDAIVGNVGSEDRLNYSAFGDSVNLAARLESINKFYGTTITISQETYKNVRHQFICRPIDIVAVKGKNEGIPIYELLFELSDEHHKNLDIEIAQGIADITTQAFKLYLAQEWDQAIKIYQDLKKLNPKDTLPDIFIERCKDFKKFPPGESWAGICVMKRK